jgi:hypothetical protein
MESVEFKFSQMLDELNQPSTNHYAGDKQIYYITFPPGQILTVKRKYDTLVNLAIHRGWTLHPLSVAQVLNQFFQTNSSREFWLEQEEYYDAQTFTSLFDDLGTTIRNQGVIEQAVLNRQAELAGQPNALLLITDLECLHPYSRFGPIEQQLYHNLTMPMAVLYPGHLSGSSLDFLSIYPPDGSYRSKHL